MNHQTETRREGTVFELNRTLESNTQALLWLEALKCSQVKFDLLGSSAQLIEETVKRESDGKIVKEIRVKDCIRRTGDLLYGISFSVAVTDLYIWFQSMTDIVSIAVVDLRKTDSLIKKVTFAKPIPLINGHVTFNISYRYSETEFPADFLNDTSFLKDTKAIHPCYTVGILADAEYSALFHSFMKAVGPGIYGCVPLSVVPSVHFKDNSIKRFDLVTVDSMSLLKH